ncbi:unnamed protein product, partial [Effrenium voratum]
MAKKKKSGQAGASGYAGETPDAADASEDSWRSVQPWLLRQGGKADVQKVTLEADKERRVVAAADLKKGEPLFHIPQHLWFTAAGLTSHEAGRLALKWAAKPPSEIGLSHEHVELCLLALLLLLEKAARQSRWAEYISALPWSARLPLTWSPAEMSRLRGAAPQWQIEEKQKQLESAFSSLSACLKGQAAAELKAASPSSSDFILAFSLAHSRAMGISSDGEGRQWRLAMLPFADMLNHSSAPEVDWDVVQTKEGLCAVFRACRDAAKGSELHISYKRAASAQAFFATYGFIEDSQKVTPSELRLEPWSGPGAGETVSALSVASLRHLLSLFRAQEVGAEFAAARFPLSQASELAALTKLRSCLRDRLASAEAAEAVEAEAVGAVVRLREADTLAWRRLETFASKALQDIEQA